MLRNWFSPIRLSKRSVSLDAGWSITGSAANRAMGVASDLEQSLAFVDGGVYRIEWTLAQVTAGTARVRLAGATPVEG